MLGGGGGHLEYTVYWRHDNTWLWRWVHNMSNSVQNLYIDFWNVNFSKLICLRMQPCSLAKILYSLFVKENCIHYLLDYIHYLWRKIIHYLWKKTLWMKTVFIIFKFSSFYIILQIGVLKKTACSTWQVFLILTHVLYYIISLFIFVTKHNKPDILSKKPN